MEGFWLRLLTPSPIMHGLLLLLPATILVSALSGWWQRERGNRRLTLWAGLLTLWVFLPVTFPLIEMRQLSAMATMLAWVGLVGAWGHHVWTFRPTPVWAHGVVIAHLMAIGVAVVVAILRAALTGG